jgi:hypothetical protein
MFISHKHQAEDGLPNLEELQEKEAVSEDNASLASVIRPPREVQEKRESSVVFSSEVCNPSKTLVY